MMIATTKKRSKQINKHQVSLASRFDSYGNDPSGHIGRQWRAEVEDKIEKWQELQTAKTKKALPKPDDMPARKRGGKRYVGHISNGMPIKVHNTRVRTSQVV